MEIAVLFICIFCRKEFKDSHIRKYCSLSCAGKARIDDLVKRNKDRRKYDEVDGKTRQQVYWLNNHESREKHLSRDRNKRQIVIEYLGGKCVSCGYEKDKRALVLDHINGDGKEDRKRIGSRIYRYYAKNLSETKDRIQVLCANCNLIKSFDNEEHNITRRVYKTERNEDKGHALNTQYMGREGQKEEREGDCPIL